MRRVEAARRWPERHNEVGFSCAKAVEQVGNEEVVADQAVRLGGVQRGLVDRDRALGATDQCRAERRFDRAVRLHVASEGVDDQNARRRAVGCDVGRDDAQAQDRGSEPETLR